MLHNSLTPSRVLPIYPPPAVNGSVTSALIFHADTFPAKFIPAATIPAGTRKVGVLGLVLVAVDGTTNDVEPFSYNEEDGKLLFQNTNMNKELRIQFW